MHPEGLRIPPLRHFSIETGFQEMQCRGHPLVRWSQWTKPFGHWLTLKMIAGILVPGYFKVLQLKIAITARPEKSKDF